MTVRRAEHLAPEEVAEVLALTRAAGDADGAYPLSEHVVLHIRHGGEAPAVHLLIRAGADHTGADRADGDRTGADRTGDDRAGADHTGADRAGGDQLVGYAHVDTTDKVAGASAELTVHPLWRRRGLGRALVEAAIKAAEEQDPEGRLRLWAHGDHPSASALAMKLGFERWRVLWQLRRSLYAEVAAPTLPDGVTLRPFVPGEDDEGWLAVNNRAFADHPDQGGWTLQDLRIRMREPWFDPAGFLLAVRDGRILGFHWTKVHGNRGTHDHDPIGEVYVLGIDPDAQGLGLGAALTLAGLRHLRARDLDQAMLYVDESNTRAVRLYERLGFARWATDVCYRRQV